MAGTYKIICKPQDRTNTPTEGDEAENRSAMVVKLTNGSHSEEVCRVGFARRNTKHPDVSFADQLRIEISKAREAVTILNDQLSPSGELL